MHCLPYLNKEIFAGLIIERLQVLSVIFKAVYCTLYLMGYHNCSLYVIVYTVIPQLTTTVILFIT